MATIRLDGTKLIVRLRGWQALFAFKREIVIDRDTLESVSAGTVTSLAPNGLRLPGTYVPRVIAAGSYWVKGPGWSFWSVRNPKKAVDIRLSDEHYTRLVIEVDDPHATAEMIDEFIRSRPIGASRA